MDDISNRVRAVDFKISRQNINIGEKNPIHTHPSGLCAHWPVFSKCNVRTRGYSHGSGYVMLPIVRTKFVQIHFVDVVKLFQWIFESLTCWWV